MKLLRTRIPPPLYAMAAAALMWWIDGALPIVRLIYAPWSRLGWAFVVLGVGIDAYAAASFFRARTTVNPLRVASAMHLVTSGIYRWSRNPMYCGLIIALAGWGLILGSLAPFLAIIVFARILVMVQIGPEESALEARFGDDYRAYKRRVNRWIGGKTP